MTEEQESERDQKSHGQRLAEDIQGLVGDIDKAVRRTVPQVGETVKEGVKEAVDGVRTARNNVVMVRVNEESLARLDDLTEAGVVGSRSEAAAFLISQGIKARQGLFDRIEDKLQEIRNAKEELRHLLEEDETS